MPALPVKPAVGNVPRDFFTATHWSVVLAAGRAESPRNQVAREELCRTYWPPIYSYIRCCGFGVPDAQDHTQGFFLRLLGSRSLAGLDPRQGKFRAFLLAALKHFLADERDRANAVKRGSGHAVFIDFQVAETWCRPEQATSPDADALFDRRWALTLLEQALVRLEHEFAAASKLSQFGRLKGFLSREPRPGEYAQVGRDIGLTPGALAVAVHRLRQRYRELLQEEIARTVATPEEVGEELHYLFSIVNR